jgi:phosphoribosylanthranilate isomerase
MKLKICGMRDPQNTAQIAALEPDYLGFIFYAPSPRYVEKETPKVPQSIKKVGVFVDASIDYVISCIKQHHLQAVQLHGKENPVYCNEIKSLNVEVIKAFAVGNKFDFKQLDSYQSSCDFFLFDTQTEQKGGSGKKFDWTLLHEYPLQKPFFLSGGIGPHDLEAIKVLKKTNLPLYALDVNSKFETAPALKNSSALSIFKKELNDL